MGMVQILDFKREEYKAWSGKATTFFVSSLFVERLWWIKHKSMADHQSID